MFTRKTITVALSSLFLITLTPVVSAFASWDQNQFVDIEASGFSQVLFFDFEENESRLSSTGFGDHQVNFFLNFPEANGSLDYIGAFLYDYSTNQFTAQFFATATRG